LWQLPEPVIVTGEIKRLLDHKGQVHCLALSQDGKTLAAGGEDNVLRLWDLDTKQLIHSFTHSQIRGGIHHIALAPGGRHGYFVWGTGLLLDPLVWLFD